MKSKLLFLFSFALSTLYAQTTHPLGWWYDSTDQQITINVGDTIEWTWGPTGTHNLVRLSGPEQFGFTQRYGPGYTYSHTFINEGINTYHCSPHPSSMYGTITVIESTAGLNDSAISEFTYYPNPVNDQLTISAQSNVKDISVFNLLGQVVSRQSPNTKDCLVDMASMQTGAYFVQILIGSTVEMVRVLKQ
jgi:hypothetical protein